MTDYNKFIQNIKKHRRKILLLSLALIEALDLFFLFIMSSKRFPELAKSFLEAIKFNSMRFKPSFYSDAINFTSFLISFFIGGIITFVVIKIVSKMILGYKLLNYEFHTLLLLYSCIFITVLGGLFSRWSFVWVCPLLSYAGGLFIYILSGIRLKINI